MNDEVTIKPEEQASPRQVLLCEIGRKLTEAREMRGEGIDTPARLLKLSRSNLVSLESGNWKDLPDEVYALGFLRQYSRHLQLDISHDLELLKNDQYQLTKPITFPDPAVAPSRKWAWIAGIAFVVLFILFNIINSSNSEVEAPDAVVEFAPTMQSELETATVDEAEPVRAAEELAVESTSPATANSPTDSPTAVADRPAQEKEVAVPQKHLYRFEAVNGDVWLQIFLPDESGNKNSKPHREALLKQGYHVNVSSSSERLWITCGNALSLRIKVDGKIAADTGSLSNNRKILRDHLFSIGKP